MSSNLLIAKENKKTILFSYIILSLLLKFSYNYFYILHITKQDIQVKIFQI